MRIITELKRNFLRAGILIAAAVLLGGCGGKSENTASLSSEQESDRPKIGLVFDSFVIERWERDRDIFTSTAKDLGADVIVGNANGDISEQKTLIRHMIDSDVDVLVIVATDCGSLSDEVADAHKAGIKVISYDRLIQNADTDLYITFDNEAVGRYMAEAINDALPDGGTYVKLNGSSVDNNVTLVNEGFDAVIHDNIRLLDSCYCDNWDDSVAYSYLTEHPEYVEKANAYMCGNDAIAGQVVRVLAEQKKAGSVTVTGQDADLDACQRIVEGTQTVTVYKPIEKLAEQTADIAVQMAKGASPDTTETIHDGTYDVPYIAIKPVKVTKDNMDSTVIDSGFHMKEDVYLHAQSDENVSYSS
ncbi:MAG: substrate-binding domain-containing protein [Eubacterium sp.]|nr:substrate-binding domain-containing protein [Eubacterium sp.]